MAKAPWLSHFMSGGCAVDVPCSCIGHLAPLDASDHAIYSASGVDVVTRSFHDCRDGAAAVSAEDVSALRLSVSAIASPIGIGEANQASVDTLAII